MKPVLHILLKIWVQQFYQRNAGFFLFLFVVLFGVVQNPLEYHYQLMQGIVTSYVTLTIAIIIWLLYACKCAMLVIKSITTERVCLSELQAIEGSQLMLLFTVVQILLFLPATIYILFTVCTGLLIQQYVAVILLCLFLIVIHGVVVVLYHKFLFNNTALQLFRKPLFTYHLPKGFYSFFIVVQFI